MWQLGGSNDELQGNIMIIRFVRHWCVSESVVLICIKITAHLASETGVKAEMRTGQQYKGK